MTAGSPPRAGPGDRQAGKGSRHSGATTSGSVGRPLQRGMLKLHPGVLSEGEVKAVRQRLEGGAGIGGGSVVWQWPSADGGAEITGERS